MISRFLPSPWVGLWGLGLVSLLAGLGGCVIVSAKAPEPGARVDVCATSPTPLAARHVRYTPYATALQRVQRQQVTVDKELRGGDWAELRDELGDWQHYTRQLLGVADTASDADGLRQACRELLRHIAELREAAATNDGARARRVLADAGRVVDELSARYPLTEPAPTADPGAADDSCAARA